MQTSKLSLITLHHLFYSKLSAHWATMENRKFIVVPLNILPSEETEGPARVDAVDKKKQEIRDRILKKTNWEVSQDPEQWNCLDLWDPI